MREISPVSKLGLLYADVTIDMPAYAQKYRVQALHPALYNIQFPGFIEECHKEGIAVNVWTVDSDEYIEMSYRAGVDAIITNYPDKAFEVIGRLI